MPWPSGGSSPAGPRFAELHAGAVERLGDRAAAVRIGALYALEALGHRYSRGRTTIVDVLATFLRTGDPAWPRPRSSARPGCPAGARDGT